MHTHMQHTHTHAHTHTQRKNTTSNNKQQPPTTKKKKKKWSWTLIKVIFFKSKDRRWSVFCWPLLLCCCSFFVRPHNQWLKRSSRLQNSHVWFPARCSWVHQSWPVFTRLLTSNLRRGSSFPDASVPNTAVWIIAAEWRWNSSNGVKATMDRMRLPAKGKIPVRSVCVHASANQIWRSVCVHNNNNNNVHLSCAHQCPERSHDTLLT